MKRKIKSYPKITNKQAKKGSKISVPAKKAAEKELNKAQKRLATAKERLRVIKIIEQKNKKEKNES